MNFMNQLIMQSIQSETSETLIERTPLKEAPKQYPSGITWEDLRGLF